MTALSADRNTPERELKTIVLGVAASTKLFAGALVAVLATGYATKGQAATGMYGIGRAEEQVDNSAGSAGDKTVRIHTGTFRWANSASTDAITAADIGRTAYIVDDATVAKTDGGGLRSPAGRIVAVETAGVWVDMGPGALALGKVYLAIDVDTLVGTNVYRTTCPVAGTITAIRSVTEGALTTADATLTAKIHPAGAAGVAVTGGVITITQSGSAAGDLDSCAPTAANVVAPGDAISLTVGGGQQTASKARCLVEITL